MSANAAIRKSPGPAPRARGRAHHRAHPGRARRDSRHQAELRRLDRAPPRDRHHGDGAGLSFRHGRRSARRRRADPIDARRANGSERAAAREQHGHERHDDVRQQQPGHSGASLGAALAAHAHHPRGRSRGRADRSLARRDRGHARPLQPQQSRARGAGAKRADHSGSGAVAAVPAPPGRRGARDQMGGHRARLDRRRRSARRARRSGRLGLYLADSALPHRQLAHDEPERAHEHARVRRRSLSQNRTVRDGAADRHGQDQYLHGTGTGTAKLCGEPGQRLHPRAACE